MIFYYFLWLITSPAYTEAACLPHVLLFICIFLGCFNKKIWNDEKQGEGILMWGLGFIFMFLFIDSYVTFTFPRRTSHLGSRCLVWVDPHLQASVHSPEISLPALNVLHQPPAALCRACVNSIAGSKLFFSPANLALTYAAPLWIWQRNKKAKGFFPVSRYFHYHKPYNIEEGKQAPPKADEWESAKLGKE